MVHFLNDVCLVGEDQKNEQVYKSHVRLFGKPLQLRATLYLLSGEASFNIISQGMCTKHLAAYFSVQSSSLSYVDITLRNFEQTF